MKKYAKKPYNKTAKIKTRDMFVVTDTPRSGEEYTFLSMDPTGIRWDVVVPQPLVRARATAGCDETLDSQVVFSITGDDDRGNSIRAVVKTDHRNRDELIVSELHVTPPPPIEAVTTVS